MVNRLSNLRWHSTCMEISYKDTNHRGDLGSLFPNQLTSITVQSMTISNANHSQELQSSQWLLSSLHSHPLKRRKRKPRNTPNVATLSDTGSSYDIEFLALDGFPPSPKLLPSRHSKERNASPNCRFRVART